MRILVMVLANILILLVAYGIPINGVIALTPLIAIFNAIQGFLGMLGGYFIFKALVDRVSTFVLNKLAKKY